MARAIMAGVSLGIFEALDEKPDDADGLARRLKLDPRGTDILLVALHALGYLEQRDGNYRNAPAVEKFVLPDSPQTLRAYVGDFNRGHVGRVLARRGRRPHRRDVRAARSATRTTRTGSATCAACST